MLWKANSPELPTNKLGSLCCLVSLLKRLKKDQELFQQYDWIIRDQLKEGIIEEVSEGEPTGKEFKLPHKPLVCQSAESIKLRIVFNASTSENDQSPSLNDVIEVETPLQNHLWKVLVRNRMCPVTLTGGIKKLFYKFVSQKKIETCCGFIGLKTYSQKTLRYTYLGGNNRSW